MRFESEALPLANTAWNADWENRSGRSMPVLQSLRAIADDGWLGSLMVQQIPDDTIALSNLCTEQQLSDDEQHKIRVALLQQSVLLSEITLPRYVRYLVSAKDSLVLKALSAAAFRSAGPVEEWTRSEKMTTRHCLPPVGCVFYWIDAADISTESSAHFTRFSTRTSIETSAGRFEVSQPVLCGLLDQSLQHSNDLPGLPLPTADQLLRLWRLSSSTIRIFLAVQNNVPVGFMATNVVEDVINAVGPEIIIEYIGLRFDSR
ncbi:MAG: hypothetical protein ABGZ24_28245, partial [Fuerstiella sp.]